jgi:hypothetical protein
MILGRPERLSGSRPTRVIVGMRPRARYLSMYERPVRRTWRPWKKRLLLRRLLPRLLARLLLRRLLARRVPPRLLLRCLPPRLLARLLPPRLLALRLRVRAAFLAARERAAFFDALVRAAFFAPVTRLNARTCASRCLRPPPRRLRPVLAIVIPPELADSDTPAVL